MHYRLRYDRDNFMVGDISPHEIRAKLGSPFVLRHNPINPWAEMWQPLVMAFSDESDAKNVVALPDITVWFTDNLILSQKAYDMVCEALEPYGEFLPVLCENIPYWVFHLTYITGTDAVDEEKSERFVDESTFINLEKLVFRGSAVDDLLLFKSEFTGYRNVYCTEKFKTLIEGAKLQGLIFTDDLAQKREP